jgi:hypothetical protein
MRKGEGRPIEPLRDLPVRCVEKEVFPMTRSVATLLAVALLIASSAAFAQSSYRTSTSIWDLQQQLSPITLGTGLMYVSGTGIRISGSSTTGVASFLSTDAPFPVDNVVGSWNVDMPSGTGLRIEMRAVNGGTSTAWYEVARQGTTTLSSSRKKSDSYGYIDQDTLMTYSNWPRIEYRVTLYTNTVGVTPTLRLMSLCYADDNYGVAYVPLANPSVTTSLTVPWRSQYWVAGIGGVICGPTSMSMAMAYNGCNLPTETVAAEDYDSYNDMYGNWPFLAQTAANHGFKSYYTRSNGQQPLRDFFAAGVPVEFGMAYSAGQLTNSPIPSTGGHLVMCVGVTSNGDYICCDPAGSDSRWDHVVYLKNEIANVWLGNGGTTIPCIPNSVYWRFPYYAYKSTDPISTRKDGRMELFAKGVDNNIYHMTQTSANGGWSSWSSMGGPAASDPVAVTNRTGGNTVFARFSDGNLYYSWQNGSSGSYSSWINLGGPIAGRPSVGKSPDGRMDVFCRMPDGSIQHRWEDTSSGWQPWASLSGSVSADPVAALNWEGREEVFVRGTDNQLYHKWQLNDGSWSGWASLGGTLAGDPAVGRAYDGRIEVYCRFADGTAQRNCQSGLIVGTSWSGWSAVGGSTTQNIALGRTPDFMEHVFATDGSGQITRRYQTVTDGSFTANESLAGASIAAPLVGHMEDGRLLVFSLRTDGRVWGRTQLASGGWTGWTVYGSTFLPETIPPVIGSVSVDPVVAVAGDSVYVTAYVTDNAAVASVTANGAGLANAGGGYWMGSIPASSVSGLHTVTVAAVDTSGNWATDTSGSYTTKKLYALTNRAVFDQIIGSVLSKDLFAVFGKVTVKNSGLFEVDDGSGAPVSVYIANHGLSGGEFVRVRGTLVRNGSDTHMESTSEFINQLN